VQTEGRATPQDVHFLSSLVTAVPQTCDKLKQAAPTHPSLHNQTTSYR
jgi:hypothetical protein